MKNRIALGGRVDRMNRRIRIDNGVPSVKGLILRSCNILCFWIVAGLCFSGNVAAASAASAASAARMLSEMAVPEGATLAMVSDNTVVNGRAMAVATLDTSAPSQSVIEFYRNHWSVKEQWALPGREDMPAFIETRVPGWMMISRLVGGYHVVVQLSTERGENTSGLVSIAPLERGASTVDHGVFSNLDLLSSNLSRDGVDTSSMRVYGSDTSAHLTRDRYRDLLLRQGWQLLADMPVDSGLITQLGLDNKRLELTFMADQDFASVVVVHEITSN